MDVSKIREKGERMEAAEVIFHLFSKIVLDPHENLTSLLCSVQSN